MVEPLTVLDRLSEQFATWNQKVAVTVAAAGVMLIVLLTTPRVRRWLDERTRPLYADVVATTLLVGTFALTVAVSLGVWGQTGELTALYREWGLGEEAVARGILSLVVLVCTYIVARVARRFLKEVLGSAQAVTDHQREVTHRLSQVIIWTASLIVVLGVWEVNLGGLLLGAGFAGIVLGMAARQTLGALIAGFVLMFARPFQIGDWVEVADHEGIVTDISIVNTRIQSVDGEYVMVPNDVVGSSVVTNKSRKGRLRIEVDVGVDYAADVDRAMELAEAAVEDLEAVTSVPEPTAVTKEFADSSVLLGVRFWIDKPSARRRWKARTAAIGAIKETFEAEGIKIPYPQRELSGRAETGGFRIADERLAYDERRAEEEGRSTENGDGGTETDERRAETDDRRSERPSESGRDAEPPAEPSREDD